MGALADRLADSGPAGASAGGLARVSFGVDGADARRVRPAGGRHQRPAAADWLGVQRDWASWPALATGRRSIGSSMCAGRCVLSTGVRWPSPWGPTVLSRWAPARVERGGGALAERRAADRRSSPWPKTGPKSTSLLTAAGRLFTARRARSIGRPCSPAWAAAGSTCRRMALPDNDFGWATAQMRRPPGKPGAGPGRAVAAPCPPTEQHRRLVELVCAHAATVSGIRAAVTSMRDRAFTDLGFDSLTGVELRNRLKDRDRVGFVTHPDLRLSHSLSVGRSPASSTAARANTRNPDEEKIWSSLRKIPLARASANRLARQTIAARRRVRKCRLPIPRSVMTSSTR